MNTPLRVSGFILITLVIVTNSENAAASAFVPSDDAQIVESLPSRPNDREARELRHLREQLALQPNHLPLAAQLARGYIEKARAQADPRYLGYAQAALAPWWKMARPPSEALILRATIKQSNHHFEEALADLSLVLKNEPGNAQARLTRASLLRVQGEYEAANQDCVTLLRFATELVASSCLSGVAALNGKLLRSYDLLREAYKKSVAANISPGEKLWVLTDLAEMAVRAGWPQTAETHFRDALALTTADSYLVAAYSDFLLDQGRLAEVISLLKDKTRADGLLLRLALAEQALHSDELPMHIAALRARFEASRLRGDTVHRREEARFVLKLLNDPQRALKLAQQNWAVQREPWDVRVFLEAAIAASRPEEARVVLSWLAENELEDTQITRAVQQLQAMKS